MKTVDGMTVAFYNGYETLDTSPSDVLSAAEFDYKQLAGTVTISADQTHLAETVDYTAINSTTLTIPGGLAYNHDPATIVTSVPAEPNAMFDAILMEDSDSENSFFIINEDYSLISAEPLADNSWIEDAITGTGSGFETADAVLDFTERNPFGEPD